MVPHLTDHAVLARAGRPDAAMFRTASLAWLLLSIAVSARAASPAQSGSVERALAMIKQGVNGPQVVAMLEPLAYADDEQAQLLLGAVYFEGKLVPRDVVQGYAWLEVAASAKEEGTARQAKEMMRRGGTEVSGSQLIEADQRAAVLRSEVADRNYARYGAAFRLFTPERPESFTPWIKFDKPLVQLNAASAIPQAATLRQGCAATPSPRCPSKSRVADGPRCTGRIVQPDRGASSVPGMDVYVVVPNYPHEFDHIGGRVTMLLHVDRSGWICAATVAASSGEPVLDAGALDAIALWRLKPATRDGEPIEALHLVSFTFNAH